MVARTLNAARVYLGRHDELRLGPGIKRMRHTGGRGDAECFAAYGGNRLDTARIYANGKGESHVREAIERSGIRTGGGAPKRHLQRTKASLRKVFMASSTLPETLYKWKVP